MFSYTQNVTYQREAAAILLCFLAGIVEILCSVLRLGIFEKNYCELFFCNLLLTGFLVDFVSNPVVSGFTSAGAITIASAQVKNLFGIPKLQSSTFLSFCYEFILNVKDSKLWDTILGLSCCIFLLIFRVSSLFFRRNTHRICTIKLFLFQKIKDFGTPPFSKKANQEKQYFKNFIWFSSIARNAFIVVATSVLAFIFTLYGMYPFSLTCKSL